MFVQWTQFVALEFPCACSVSGLLQTTVLSAGVFPPPCCVRLRSDPFLSLPPSPPHVPGMDFSTKTFPLSLVQRGVGYIFLAIVSLTPLSFCVDTVDYDPLFLEELLGLAPLPFFFRCSFFPPPFELSFFLFSFTAFEPPPRVNGLFFPLPSHQSELTPWTKFYPST